MTDEITKIDCQGEGEADDRETFSDPTDIVPMTEQYDWRCFVDTRYGPYFLCKDGYPLKDSSEWNAGWRVCAAEVGRERSIMKFAADIARLNAELTEARKIIAELIEGSEEDDNELLEALAPHIGTEPGNIDITHPATRRARAFLTKGETDNG